MSITNNNSGTPLYHYSKRLIEDNKKAALMNKDKPMTRKQRRKLDRQLKKKGVVIDKLNNCLIVEPVKTGLINK